MIAPEAIQRVAEASDIVDLIGASVLLRKVGAIYTGLCPFHQEKTPSLTVTPATRRWKCFGCGAGGDVFAFAALTENTTFPLAVRHLANRAGICLGSDIPKKGPAVAGVAPRQQILERTQKHARPAVSLSLHPGSRKELTTVANLRELSLAGVILADARGLLRFGSPRGCPSWIVTDGACINAQARRLDGSQWAHIGGKKAYTLPGSRASWPIGAQESEPFPCIIAVEGGPDLLAAHHFISAEGREADTAVVAMLGAWNSIPEDALRPLAHKRIRIFPHADPAGEAAAVRWTEQFERVGCEVDAFHFDGLCRADGGLVKDLNDLALLDADTFEAERTELERILP